MALADTESLRTVSLTALPQAREPSNWMKNPVCACWPAEIAACVHLAPELVGLHDQPCQFCERGRELPAGSVTDAVSWPVPLLPVSVTLKNTLAPPWRAPPTLMDAESLNAGDDGFGEGELGGVGVGVVDPLGRGVGLVLGGDELFATTGVDTCAECEGAGADDVATGSCCTETTWCRSEDGRCDLPPCRLIA